MKDGWDKCLMPHHCSFPGRDDHRLKKPDPSCLQVCVKAGKGKGAKAGKAGKAKG